MESEIMTQDQWENTKDIVTKCFTCDLGEFFKSINFFPLYNLNKKNFKNDAKPYFIHLGFQNTFQLFFLFYFKKINIDINEFLKMDSSSNLQDFIMRFFRKYFFEFDEAFPISIYKFIEKLGPDLNESILNDFWEYINFSVASSNDICKKNLNAVSFKAFYYQGPNNFSLYLYNNSRLRNDYSRSRDISDETKRLVSLCAITMFSEHEYFYSNKPPTLETLKYNIAINNLFNEEQFDKLAYIKNTDEKNLNETQIEIKQIFDSIDFIEVFNVTTQTNPDEIYNESHLPDKNHLQKILLLPDENLTPNEITFKDIYSARLTKIYSDVFTEIMQRKPEPNEIPDHIYLANFILGKNDGSLIPEDLRDPFKTKIQELGIRDNELSSGKVEIWTNFPDLELDEIPIKEETRTKIKTLIKMIDEVEKIDENTKNSIIKKANDNFYEEFGDKYMFEKGNGFLKCVGSGFFNSADIDLVVFLTMQKLSVCYPTKQFKILNLILRSNQLSSDLKNRFQIELQDIKDRKIFFMQVFNGNFNDSNGINDILLNLSKCYLTERFEILNLLFSRKSKLSDIHKENLINSDEVKSLIQSKFLNEKGNGFFKAVSLGVFNEIDAEELCEAIVQKSYAYKESKQRKIFISLISNESKLPSGVKEDLKNYLLLSKTERIPKLISIDENTPLLQ